MPLPAPVPPHGEIALDIAFRAKLPKIFARTGYVRDYFLVGQWFPKIGVYEPAGMRNRKSGGWNCHAFHANSEFYADYGNYDVTFTVPSKFVVGATGKQVSATPKDGQDDVPLRPEGRSRLRVDGRSPLAGHGVHLRSRPRTSRRDGRNGPRTSSACRKPRSP